MRTARGVTLSAMGTVVALAAFEHGLGELLQGSVSPPGPVIQSWPDSEFYRSLQGEPALTLIPNLAISGVLTILLSVAFLVWVLWFVEHRRSVAVIAGLSVALLLVGGGFGPPLLGLILALSAIKLRSRLPWWRERAPQRMRHSLATAWPGLLVACVGAWLFMLFGVAALDYFLGVDSVALTLAVLSLAFALLPAAVVSSFARDAACRTSGSS